MIINKMRPKDNITNRIQIKKFYKNMLICIGFLLLSEFGIHLLTANTLGNILILLFTNIIMLIYFCRTFINYTKVDVLFLWFDNFNIQTIKDIRSVKRFFKEEMVRIQEINEEIEKYKSKKLNKK